MNFGTPGHDVPLLRRAAYRDPEKLPGSDLDPARPLTHEREHAGGRTVPRIGRAPAPVTRLVVGCDMPDGRICPEVRRRVPDDARCLAVQRPIRRMAILPELMPCLEDYDVSLCAEDIPGPAIVRGIRGCSLGCLRSIRSAIARCRSARFARCCPRSHRPQRRGRSAH